MKRLLVYALLVVAIWMAWKHGPQLLQRSPQHEIVVVNRSGPAIERLRVSIAGRTFVRDTLRAGTTTEFHVPSSTEGAFHVVWQRANTLGEHTWDGGHMVRGPVPERHRIAISGDDVIYFSEPLPEPGAGTR